MSAPAAFPIFGEVDRSRRTVVFPNLSEEFTRVMRVAVEQSGYRVEQAPLADARAVELGKSYVHNDICYPAQVNVGELLSVLRSGRYQREEVAVGLGKTCRACRALQYYALSRRALDAAGFADVPIVTNGTDYLGMHPGFKLGLKFKLLSLQGMVFTDALNELRQKLIPYADAEQVQAVHRQFLDEGMVALARGFRPLMKVLERAVRAFNELPSDRSQRKPVVGICGEILVHYHPTANYGLVDYLLKNGMEVQLPPILEFFRQDVVIFDESWKRGFSKFPLLDWLGLQVSRVIFEGHVARAERLLRSFKYYERRPTIFELRDKAATILNTAFFSGEGWLIPGELLSMIEHGTRAFVIVQPFGCLPNHVSGRGVIRAVKDRHPDVQILSLDYDPDVSIGNIENRLQMLVLAAKRQRTKPAG